MRGINGNEDNPVPVRKINRYPEFDYSSCTAYFITVCTKDRSRILWDGIRADIPEGILSQAGIIVRKHINNIPYHYPDVTVDTFAVMPDHIHLLLRINGEFGEKSGVNISTVIRQFKKSVTMEYGESFWQKSFYDRIIRGMDDYIAYYRYIVDNPGKWIAEKKRITN